MSLFIWSEIQMWVAGYVQQYQLTGSKSAAVRACNHAPVPPQASRRQTARHVSGAA